MAAIHDLLDRYQSLVRKREPWMAYWQELGDVLLPNKADFTSPTERGKQRGADIYDATPRLALRDLASTLDGLIKPKTSNWFDVVLDDPGLAEVDEVKLWMETVRDLMWKAIYRKDARFIHRSGEVDSNLACFGWGALWIQENAAKNGLLFRSFHTGKVAIDENEDGEIDTIAVEEDMDVRQAAALYKRAGKDPGKHITEALKNSKRTHHKGFKFVQIVLPSTDRHAELIKEKRLPFSSVIIDVKGEEIIAETGFHEFPVAVPRWDTASGEVYARSPGAIALPDARTLQAIGKTLLVGGQRAVDPPTWVANDSVLSPLRTFPGGVTVLDLHDLGGQTPIGSFPVATNLPIGRDIQNDYRRQVDAAFFKNVFNLPIDGRQMTATEILERKEEFVRVIGPVFGRLESDYIGHIVERVFGIMERAGAFPLRPEILEDRRVSFRFQSPLQQARKALDMAGLSRAIQLLAPLAQTQPEIMDNFNGDQIARDAPEWSGMPQKWLRTKGEVDVQREGREQSMQAQQSLAQAEPISKALRNVAAAEGTLR